MAGTLTCGAAGQTQLAVLTRFSNTSGQRVVRSCTVLETSAIRHMCPPAVRRHGPGGRVGSSRRAAKAQ